MENKLQNNEGVYIGAPERGMDINDLSLVCDEDSFVIKGNIAFGQDMHGIKIAKELRNVCQKIIAELENRSSEKSDSDYVINRQTREFSGYVKLSGGEGDILIAKDLIGFFNDMMDLHKGEISDGVVNPDFGNAFS